MLYPLSYGGVTHTSSEWAASRRGATDTSRWHTISSKSRTVRLVEWRLYRSRSVSGVSVHPNRLK